MLDKALGKIVNYDLNHSFIVLASHYDRKTFIVQATANSHITPSFLWKEPEQSTAPQK